MDTFNLKNSHLQVFANKAVTNISNYSVKKNNQKSVIKCTAKLTECTQQRGSHVHYIQGLGRNWKELQFVAWLIRAPVHG